MLRYLGAVPDHRRPALFVDRDGVLNERIVDGYVLSVADLRPRDAALDALKVAQENDAALIVVTNQGALAKGLLDEGTLLAIHGALVEHLGAAGIVLDGIYVCPHHPDAVRVDLRRCSCRKPAPGLLLQAAADLNIDLARSAMIGDGPSDAAAAIAAGIAPEAALSVSDATDGFELTRAVTEHFRTGDTGESATRRPHRPSW